MNIEATSQPETILLKLKPTKQKQIILTDRQENNFKKQN